MRYVKYWVQSVILRYSWRQQLGGFLGLWGIIQCLIVLLLWRPSYQQLQDHQQRVRLEQQRWEQRHQRVMMWQHSHRTAMVMKHQLAQVQRASYQPDVVTWFTQQARHVGLVVEYVMVSSAHSSGAVTEIRFKVIGHYRLLGELINVLTHYGRDVEMLELKWQSRSQTQDSIRLSGRLRILPWSKAVAHD
ncbi:hypothetical protein [Vibrio palustris]|uniref:Pilus assembly protein, PilO n=1 Tax=Vibrio palustris TaxID=1918946 RepID=A0A1R4B474_9VIBR|nr:hypothetical protein [Vibrio palustris]SJL83722.1 hypothetical protein VPAL9027_01700 [Vibrio palustris]